MHRELRGPRVFLTSLVGLSLLWAPGWLLAEDVDKKALAEKFSGVSEEDISDSPLPGVYEIAVGPQVAYISADGRYLIRGDIIDLDGSVNLTEKRRNVARARAMHGVPEAKMIVFAPDESVTVKHTVTVFTDIDCSYCRRFHREMDEINKRGIRVQYLFFPRYGPGSPSWAKADSVWCAKDRNAALTQAKNDQPVESAECGDSPVTKHYELGEMVGVRGTPGIFTEGGEYIGGYLPPDRLQETLDSLDADAAAAAN